MPELLTVALGHAERGWHVFPLVPDSKRPAVDRWEQRATTDPQRIRRCWSIAPFGIGIACGPSDLLVVDLDQPKHGQTAPAPCADQDVRNGADVLGLLCAQHDDDGAPELWSTYSVTTGTGGLHLYTRHPTGAPLRNTAGRLGWLIDTRAHGGFVVAAGSTVAGRPYRAERDVAPQTAPAWLARLLRPLPVDRAAGPVRVLGLPTGRQGAYLRAAVDRTLDKLAEASEGGRNAALFMAAQTLGQLVAGGALSEQTVTDALTPAAARLGLDERETAATIRSGLRVGARRPRTVAA